MKTTITTLLILLCLSILSTAQQSTTGPTPPPGIDRGKINTTEAGQVVISGVPSYIWQHGCGPTALGMVIGYHDTHGYPDLIPGYASTQTADVNDAIANDPHYNDYSLPIDTYPDLYTDKSETGGAHASNCIADFMETSWSSRGNRYGWSYNTDVNPSFENYVQMMNSNYTTNTTFVYNNPNMWNLYKNEIDNNRPVVFLVDSDGDGNTDHFITGIGYDDDSSKYAIYDTWDNNTHWFDWHMMSNGNPWGIYTMHMLEIVSNNNTTVLISPDNQTVSTSTTFTTTVEIELVQNLGGFELDIDFDPLLLQANTLTLENFLSSTGRTVFPLANNINNTSGLIEFAATTLGATPPGPDGDGILLTIEWAATSSLASTTTTDLLLQNVQVTEPNGTLIPVTLQNGAVTITVSGGPLSVNATTTPDAICLGNNSQLNATASGGTGNYTYSWISSPPGFTSTQQNPTVTPTITTTYTVTADDGSSTASDNVTVTVNPLPVADAGADQTITMNTSTTLNGSASSGTPPYTWSWAPAGMLNDPNIQNPITTNLSTSQTYTLTVTDVNGCSSSDDVNITVQQPANYLTVTPANQNVGATAGSTTFSLSSNVTWSVTDDAGWLSVTPSSGSNDVTLTATYDANTGLQRIATITASGSGVPDVIVTVTQAGGTTTTTVFIDPSAQTVNTSQVFSTTVEIAQVQNLGGFELDLDFDPVLLQANAVTLESFLGSTGRTVFPLANNINNTTGLIEYAATTLGASPPGPDGNGILLTIEWTATSTLASTTTTDLLLQNVQVTQPNGTLIPVTLQNGALTITATGGPLSAVATANPDAICLGNTSQLNAAASGGSGTYTYSWISSPPGFTSTQQNPTVTPTVTATYTVTVDDGFSTASDNVTVTVNPLPIADAGADQTISMNTSTTLNGSASSGTPPYTWSWAPAGMLNDLYIQNPTTTNLSTSQTYTLAVTDVNGCSSSDEVNIIVDQPGNYLTVTPANQNVGATAGSTTFSLSSNVTWSVTDDAGWLSVTPSSGSSDVTLTATYDANSGLQRIATITVSGSGVPDVIVTVTQASGPIGTTIFINPPAQTVNTSQVFTTTVEIAQVQNLGGFELDLDFDPVLLQANSVTLESFLGSTGRTVFPLANNINNTSGLIEFAATTLGASPPGPDGDGILLTIEWTATSTLVSTTTTNLLLQNVQVTKPNGTLIPVTLQNGTVTVFVAGGPLTVNATAVPNTICNGGSSQLDAIAYGGTGTYSYSWVSNPAGFSSTLKNPVASPTVTTTYTVNVYDGVDNVTDMVTVVVNPAPVADAGPDASICDYETYTLYGSAANYSSLQWTTSGDGSFSDISIVNPLYTPGNNDISSGSVTLTLTSIGNTPCGNQTDEMILTINPAPTPVITGDIEVCEYESGVVYSTPFVVGNTYNWGVTGGTIVSGQGSNSISIDWSTAGAGTVVVNEINTATLCSTTTSNYNVSIHQLPIANAGGDKTIPYGTSTTINATVTGGSGTYTYSWTPAALLVDPTVEDPTTVILTDTTSFILVATDAVTGCVGIADTATMLVSGTALACDPQAIPDTICIGDIITLQANASGGSGFYTYSWISNPPGFISTGQNPTDSPLITTMYILTVDDGYSSYTDSVLVTVNPLPVVDLGPDTTICKYNTITLDAGNPGSTYNWSTGATTQTIVVDSISGSAVYSVTVTDQNGCSQSDAVVITFDPCTSLDEADNLTWVNIYPNPSDAIINIKIFNSKSEIELKIININGHVVFRDELSVKSNIYNKKYDLSELSKGVYFVKINNGRKLFIEKLVIQ